MINKVILLGNVGADPEIRTTQDGREIANFSLATTESWKDKNTGQKQSKTEWHRIVVFNSSLVDVVKSYVKKGSKIYIEGAIKTRKWQDKQGNDRYTTEIEIKDYKSTLKLVSPADIEPQQKTVAQQTQEYSDKDVAMPNDFIPF